jgi:hypothetical protein
MFAYELWAKVKVKFMLIRIFEDRFKRRFFKTES